MSSTPFVSQYSPLLPPSWQPRACGIAALTMLLGYWHTKNPALPAPDVRTILEHALAADAYLQDVGWLHKGLVQTAAFFGYTGHHVETTHQPEDEAWQEFSNVVAAFPVLASVKSSFDPAKSGGHLVLVERVSEHEVELLDPEESSAELGRKRMPVAHFRAVFKRWYIVITPNMGRSLTGPSKLDYTLAANMNIHASLMSMVLGSVGSRQYQHVYRRIKGVNVDILEGGDVSCAVHASSLLYLWGLVADTHATVVSTVRDLLASGWEEIHEPRIGCVITWEQKPPGYGKWQHPHIGFYVGQEQAVSNDPETGVPIMHHFSYGTANGLPVRQITGMYWHPSLDL